MFKSKFEETVASNLDIVDLYELHKLDYTVPESKHRYTPDFWISDKLVIETKGKFTSQDRYKMLLVKEQHPEIKIVMYFQNASEAIRKGSKTLYKTWAEKNGFTWFCYRKHKLTLRELARLIKETTDVNN